MGTLARNGLTLSVSIDHYHSAYFTKKKIPWQLNSACLLSNCLPVIHGSLANVKQRNIYLVTDFIKLSVVSLKMFSRTQKI